MSTKCDWLPKRILLPDDNWDNYPQYEEDLYSIYLADIFNKIGN